MTDEIQDTETTEPENGRQEAGYGDDAAGAPESLAGNVHPDMTHLWKDRCLRLQADLENTKKRLARSAAEEVEAKTEALLRDILPVADAMDLAMAHVSREKDSRSLLQGIDLIRSMLNKFFAQYHVKVIEAWGETFDPRLHEALGVTRNSDLPPNTVAKVERKGYLFRGRLLRPAQVLVTAG
jgi:molecular chaperone GrpE